MYYKVKENDCGFVIIKNENVIPLPYLFISKQSAEAVCAEFNEYGAIAECCYYFKSKVAGNRKIKDYKYQYEKWIVENYKNFKEGGE